MKITIRKGSFLYDNRLVVIIPYFLALIVFNMVAAWQLLHWIGLDSYPPVHLDARIFTAGGYPPRWVAIPAGILAVLEHLLITGFIDFEKGSDGQDTDE